MTPDQINQYAFKIYKQNVERGWWDDPNRCIYRTLQLVNTEIAEATEGDRKNLDDDHLPHRKMVEVEIADALIRLLDLGGRYQWIYKDQGPDLRITHVTELGAKHLVATCAVCHLAGALFGDSGNTDSEAVEYYYSIAVRTLLEISEQEGYDLLGAVNEKLAYNATRADHSRKARAHFDGKRY
jgi:hypothetical protein